MKTFFENYEKEIERRKVSGETGILVGAEVLRDPPTQVYLGKTSLLYRMAKNWKDLGGEAQVQPRIGNFEKGRLIREPIYFGEEYLVCDSEEEDATIEEIQNKIKQKGKRIVNGFIVFGEIGK